MIFEVFERVLSELDSSGEDVFGDGWQSLVDDSINTLSAYYGNNNLRNADRQLIDYGGLPTQAAYIFMYAIGRADFTYQLLCRFRKLIGSPLFKSPSINITCIGGGPASELVGLIKYIEDENNTESVDEILIDVFDKEKDWQKVVELVISNLSTEIDIHANFYEFDVMSARNINECSLKFDDMIFLSFFISEICELPNPKTVRDNIESLLNTMKDEAKLLYNDSNAYSFYTYMNNRARAIKGLTQLFEVEDMITFKYTDPGDTFQIYSDNFYRTPHLTSNAVSKIYERKIS